jgi:toxin-antitoxin system PIN domain toxin
MPKKLLPDVNVWFAMTFDMHAHHASAKLWFDALIDDTVYFCRMTQQGFLRLSTNPTTAGAEVLTMDEAWQKYDEYLRDPRIAFATEPAGLEAQWRLYSQGNTFSTNVWNDAYLASFAKLADYEVVTFDKGFTRYPGLKLNLLK